MRSEGFNWSICHDALGTFDICAVVPLGETWKIPDTNKKYEISPSEPNIAAVLEPQVKMLRHRVLRSETTGYSADTRLIRCVTPNRKLQSSRDADTGVD
ncbi:hypothetical protein TRICI_000787 [Trichomonascus ciferrii]|uniref:Uncharacterized protein n=1 Tax=Trichomonascus ciferrii TaxID=44093 RepID=A0A642VCU3_9ASCO|nr:hypothetical protein TRICI_000787 [Trichomonascus ciferrii]